MYKPGQWKAICDVCGFEFYSSELKKRWDGLMVCHEDFEHDHPQKFLKVKEYSVGVPWSRPEPEDEFLKVCYPYSSQCYADISEADCMRADTQNFTYAQCVAFKAGVY